MPRPRLLVVAAAVAALAAPAGALSQGGAPTAPVQQPPGKQPAAKQPAAKQPAPKGAANGKPKQGGEQGPPKLDARAWILVDPRDDALLAAKAQDERLPIASTTKLMTARLALEELNPNKKLVAPPYRAAAAESLLGLHAGERMTV